MPDRRLLQFGKRLQTVESVLGILPLQIREEYSSEILCLRAIEAAQAHGIVEEGDKIVFTGGIPLGIPGRTNLIRVCIVGE